MKPKKTPPKKCPHGRVVGERVITLANLEKTGHQNFFIDTCRCCKNDFLCGGYMTRMCSKCEARPGQETGW